MVPCGFIRARFDSESCHIPRQHRSRFAFTSAALQVGSRGGLIALVALLVIAHVLKSKNVRYRGESVAVLDEPLSQANNTYFSKFI